MRTTLSLTCLSLFCGLSVASAQAGPAPAPSPQSQALRNAAKALAAEYDYNGANQQLKQAFALDKTTRLQDAATDLTMIGENEIRAGQYKMALLSSAGASASPASAGQKGGSADTEQFRRSLR